MEEAKPQSLPIRFGIFEVDRQAGELRRHGFKVRLQDQPFQVLMLLLERPGEVVTREELQKKLWPSDTFVDFERGLNRAINKLREALADDPDSPRFIETLPRRGYRFIAPVEPARTRKPEAIGASQIALVPVDRPEQVEDSVSPAPARAAILPWAIAGLLAVLVVIGFLKIWLTPAIVADRPFQQLDLDAGPGDFSQPAISSDGMHIVFVSQGRLAIRHLDQSQTSLIPGTEGACYPFFSPNGQWVGFFASGKLQKVAVAGGAPIPLCDAPSPGGGSWGADDRIVATLDGSRGLFRVPAAGGTPEPLTDPRDDASRIVLHRWPQALPGGKGILFAAISASLQGSLRIVAPNGGTPRTLVENSTYGRFLASGYLVYRQRNALFAAPMDPERLVLTGPGVPLVYTVAISDGRADFDLSANGTLVYRRGTPRNSVPSWLYPSGNTEPAVAKRATYSCPRLSPDATRLAISVLEEGKQRLWVYDLGRETWSRLTSDGDAEFLPAWTTGRSISCIPIWEHAGVDTVRWKWKCEPPGRRESQFRPLVILG